MLQNYVSLFLPPVPAAEVNNFTLTMSDTKFTCPTCNSTPLPAAFRGQTTTNGNYSYAGVILNDMSGTIGIDGTAPNEFSELNAGIIAINSSLLVKNSKFSQLKNYDSYTMPMNANPGTGIFVAADLGKYASLRYEGLGTTTAFDDDFIGIHTYRASINAISTTMRAMFIGIYASESSFLSTLIKENNIESNIAGIVLMNCLSGSKLNVSDNIIYSWGSPSVFNQAGILAYETIVPDKANYLINCNTVSGNFLHAYKVTGLKTTGNFYHNIADMASSNMRVGFGFYNCLFPKVDNNTASTDGTPHGRGFEFFQTYGPTVSDNTSDNTDIGFCFLSDNSNTRFIANSIGHHYIGFYVDKTGVIGQQFETVNGNKVVFNNTWLDDPSGNAYGSKGALLANLKPSSYFVNRFLYDNANTLGSPTFPHNFAQGGGTWFVGEPNPDSKDPEITSDCSVFPIQLIDNGGTVLDRFISRDSVHSEDFDEPTVHIAASGLQDKLDSSETLQNSKEYFSDFYTANELTNIGKQSKVRSSLRQIYKDANNNEDNISKNDSTIQSLLEKKSINDTLLFSGTLSEVDSLRILDENTDLLTTINLLIRQTNTMLQQFADSQAVKINLSKDLNDDVAPSTLIEKNEYQFTDIFLRNFAQGNHTVSTADRDTLRVIANQCPIIGGKAVFKAIAALAIIGDSTYFNTDSICDAQENLRISKTEKAVIQSVFVYPNPTNNEVNFLFKLPKGESAELLIYDCYSKLILKKLIAKKSLQYKLSFHGISDGIYFYQLKSSSGLVGNGKIILIRKQ